jgi:hypothetical protein
MMSVDDAVSRLALAMNQQRGNYFWEPIPVPLDTALRDFVEAFAQADAASQQQVVERLQHDHRVRISSFGIRLASMAVRFHDPELVVLGLIALWMGWPGVEDPRERVMDMAPMYQAAGKLDADPAELFDRAARIVGDKGFLRFLQAFLGRSEELKSLKTLGWREVMGPDGFRFEPGGLGW